MSVKWFSGELGKVLFLLDWIRPAGPVYRIHYKLRFFLEDFSVGKFCKDVIARIGARAMRRARAAHTRAER